MGKLIYRFLGFSRAGELVAGQFIACEDVNQACLHAHHMLGRRAIARVEVWSNDQQQVYEASKRWWAKDIS